ncbi:MAG: DUF4428 domain-containing protein [Oscillospiraceae bacterium]|nr:DUF4428 domain-containing protein [Oscillospiraceae bacterium]
MGLFDKKNCSVCGEKIGVLGNRKLEDGNLCKDCNKKLSPWFSDRKKSTVAQIEEQLAWREANKEKVAAFHVTRTLGLHTQVLLDEDNGKFLIADSKQWKNENPDVLDFSDVTGCDIDIDESRTEITHPGKDGKQVSFVPPRYKFDYDFYVTIHVTSPYYSEMRVKVNNSRVDGDSRGEYDRYRLLCEDIKAALTQARADVRESIAAANAPKMATTCPWCGATTLPNEKGCCEYCGGALGG